MHGRGGVIMLLILCLVLALPAFGGYDLSWNTIDGGGGMSKGGPYILTGTIGQPDAATSAVNGHKLLGGFWPGSVPAHLRVLSPNGGETLYARKTYPITWQSGGDTPIYDVKIEYTDDNGNTWWPIDANTINDGQHDWEVPDFNSSSTECLIRISDANDANTSDMSDSTFTIYWYPECWDWPGQCHGDCSGNDLKVNIDDFYCFKDSYGSEYPDADYNPCADFDRDGDVDTDNFYTFKDSYAVTDVPGDCLPGDFNEIYKP